MTEDETNQLAEQLWKRMEPFAKVELERLFTNYMATRTLLEPELVKKLFDAMEGDLNKYVFSAIREVHDRDRQDHMRKLEEYRRWENNTMKKLPPGGY